jgi:rare lipoprotein A
VTIPACALAISLLFMPLRKHAVCSWYGGYFHGRTTASGAVYDMHALTAAHRSLPFGTVVRIWSRAGRVIVTITDRGPTILEREFDLSRAAFAQLADTAAGLVEVKWRVINLKGDGK